MRTSVHLSDEAKTIRPVNIRYDVTEEAKVSFVKVTAIMLFNYLLYNYEWC